MHNELKKDSNALNPKFYFELLHIFGLQEKSEGGKILIGIDQNQKISFAKHIASKLESQNKPSDFETTMSHIILWLNRILFLKLIEANLLHFNDFDKSLRFLTSTKIMSFSTLAHLFFEVLAKDYAKREQDKGFNFLPYLNSSLFIQDEKETCDLSTLDDDLQILPFNATQTEYKKGESVRFLSYLFDFLECFDFGKGKDSTPSDKLINSSVLGAMFEKLNGYQEGSFYTPNFITSYMCKESLQKVVLEKFNALNPQWNAKALEDIEDEIQREKRKQRENSTKIKEKYIKLLESIRICDPSVGSGHFLVSALSEMVSIYYKLGLLEIDCDDLQILDDEIYLKIGEGNFAYKRPQSEQNKNHQIQITLFNLKKSIIENNLFGVDINPNSCNIARLRLWIELLKNAYYLNFAKDEDSKIHKLQTLPNIDINIKCGNSLISNIHTNITLENFTQNLQERQKKAGDLFTNASLESQIKDTQRKAQIKFQEMRENVESYKNENDKQASRIYKQNYEKSYQYLCELFKRNCDESINFYQELEYFFQQYGYINLRNLEEQTRFHIESYVEFFDFHKSVDFERKTQREIPRKELENLLKLMQIYEDFDKQATFEWRFAFPEVLDSNGDFLGFDLVIGNPPYIRQEEIKHLKPQLQKAFEVYKGTSDIYTYFYEQSYKILKHNGILSFITSNKWCRAAYGEPLRKFLLENTTINTYLDLNGIKVFEAATVDTSILEFHKAKANANHSLDYANTKDYNPKDEKPLLPQYSKIPQNTLSSEGFIFSDSKLAALKAKIERLGTPLKDWDININYGILTGYNEAFIIDTKKREEILSACDDSEDSLKPFPLSEYDPNLATRH